MQDENQLNPAERELALQLARLQPARHGIQRDAVLFQAGQRIALRRLRCWQAASSVLLLAAIGLWWWQPRPQANPNPVRVVSTVDPDRATQPVGALGQPEIFEASRRGSGTREYLRLRTEVITNGPEALPSPDLAPAASEGVRAASDWRLLAAATPGAVIEERHVN